MAVRPVPPGRLAAVIWDGSSGRCLAGFRTRRPPKSGAGRDRRRQYRWLHPHDDDDKSRWRRPRAIWRWRLRARSLVAIVVAIPNARRSGETARTGSERLGGLTIARRHRAIFRSFLLTFSLEAGATKILDSLNLVIAPGPPDTTQIGGRQLLFPDGGERRRVRTQ